MVEHKNDSFSNVLNLFSEEEMQIKEINLAILRKQPKLDCSVILEIQPLAPLSMVCEFPGSYYKTLKIPDKKMLCGLLENILGWHIDLSDRKTIQTEIKKLREEQTKNGLNIKFVDHTKGSTYIPLLMDYFDILDFQPSFTKVFFYDDLWNKSYRRADAVVHPKGTFNISYDLLIEKRKLKRSENNPKQVDDKELEKFFKKYLTKFPLYYSTPTNREYIFMDGKYDVSIIIDSELNAMLQAKILTDNIGYLGNNEGWVDLKIKKL